MKVSRKEIDSYFKTGKKPTEQQFKNTHDSFVHKDENTSGGGVSIEVVDQRIEEQFSTKSAEVLSAANNNAEQKDAQILSTAKSYADTKSTNALNAAKAYVDEQGGGGGVSIELVNERIEEEFSTRAPQIISEANNNAEQKDAQTLASAKSYADTKSTNALNAAKAYVDEQGGGGGVSIELVNERIEEEFSTRAPQIISEANNNAKQKDAQTLASAKSYADTKSTNALNAAKAYVDEQGGGGGVSIEVVDERIEEEFSTRVPQIISEANNNAEEKDAQTLASAKSYADTKSTNALNAAKAYVDEQGGGVTMEVVEEKIETEVSTNAAETLALAKIYAEQKDAQTLTASKDYTDTQVSELLIRITALENPSTN